MKATNTMLETMYYAKPELSDILDKLTRERVIEYIEEIQVELVWNYGKEIAKGLSVLVYPDDIEPISNKIPLAVFSFDDLLKEWIERVLDEDELTDVTALREMVIDAKAAMDRVLDRIDAHHERLQRDDALETEIERVYEERHGNHHDRLRAIYDECFAAKQAIRAELTAGRA